MSLSGPKIPPPPAAAPPTPNLEPAKQELGAGEESSAAMNKRRKGRSALRIDLQHGGSGLAPGATGVNVPMK